MATGITGTLLLLAIGITVFILVTIFVVVPLFQGVGWLIGNFFKGIGWLFAHVFEFIGGVCGDILRFIGAILGGLVLLPLALLNVVIGRWSAASHFAGALKREFRVAGMCVYRVLVQRPLQLLLLDSLLEGIEQRVPEAMAGAPPADRPSRRTGQFEGYTIVGSLRGGGSGAKLYIAEPEDQRLQRGFPSQVVIKSFALDEGSSLPQIVRESRALENARQLGLVLEHGMDEHRFFYVMPYHEGEHLGVVTRQLHGESGDNGLDLRQIAVVLGYSQDLVETLATYHRGGLWHKDVKPDNVIVRDGRAHLVDLGLVTPLRSAMTLTTHGTEYFRDPEMVRQALRGVKVHQIDGAKFDIYAAGAVLYFMLENTFPAHGALSHFAKRSPEAVRWIVKRSMADYNQRYGNADALLADLEYVRNASDAFAVRPADLPSMRGAMPPPISEEPVAAAVASTPLPATPEVAPQTRPRLTVTNWWTGAFSVEGKAAGSIGSQAPAEQSSVLKQQMGDLRGQMHRGAKRTRRIAHEQVSNARGRARALRNRAAARRKSVTQSRPASMFLGMLVFLVIVGVVVLGLYVVRSSATLSQWSVGGSSPNLIMDGFFAEGGPLLLINDHPDALDRDIQNQVQEIVRSHKRSGYYVVDDNVVQPEVARAYNRWIDAAAASNTDRDAIDQVEQQLEEALEARHLYGVLHVTEGSRHGSAGDRVRHKMVTSSRDGADDRRWPALDRPVPGLPYLLLNDHPTKNDPRVESCVEQIKQLCASVEWDTVVDDDIEVAIRKALPAGELDPHQPLSARLEQAMADQGLGGVIRIDARPGAGDAGDRIRAMVISAQVRNGGGEAQASHETIGEIVVSDR
jgi:serine/threonine protein kinase